jgi:hypothetical protein
MALDMRRAAVRAPVTTGAQIGEAASAFKEELDAMKARAEDLPSDVKAEAIGCVRAFGGCLELTRRVSSELVRKLSVGESTTINILKSMPPTEGELAARDAQGRAAARAMAERKLKDDAAASMRARIGGENAATAGVLAGKAADAQIAYRRRVDLLRCEAELPESVLHEDGKGAPARDEQRRDLEAQLRVNPVQFFGMLNKLTEVEPDRAYDLLELLMPTLSEVASRTPPAQHWQNPTKRAGVATQTVLNAKQLIAMHGRMREARRGPLLALAEEWGEHASIFFRHLCGLDVRRMTPGEFNRRYMAAGSRPIDMHEAAGAAEWPFRLLDATLPKFGQWTERKV